MHQFLPLTILLVYFQIFQQFSVTLNGVIKLLHNLKPYKASRPDIIPTCLLKECAKEIAPSLVLLFQVSLKQSIVPTEWKHAFVKPRVHNKRREGEYPASILLPNALHKVMT